MSLALVIDEKKNPRGIPAAKFVENLDEFLHGTNVETALGAYNELYSKYKFMEQSFEKSKAVYKSKVPELERTIELIEILKKKHDDKEEFITNYSLCDTIYAKAKVIMYKNTLFIISKIPYTTVCYL